jgi:GT2 family glycosyltransferase/glycosyltransferase involved in cell wall biosynthesis/2-polyprenyl-3-methyl-5-hydroxy-6-metoxy-1,4-benzoquinol methylase
MYDYKIDLSSENTSHTKILKLVGKGKYVLEIGCATGYMTRYLKEELGCRVFCVEIDPVSGEKARSYCEELVIADVEGLDFIEAVGDRRFDVVIMADVIEHLKDPRSLLGKLRDFIGESGFILFSVPNGAHGSVALELLDGKWEYRDEGLLDRTHLHFFDKDSLSSLLDETGFLISRLDRVIIHPRDTEMKTPWDSYPRDITAYLEKVNPEYQTYQFIVKAYPTSVLGWKEGLKDALESEKRNARNLEEKLKSAETELTSLRLDLAGFEEEKAEIRRGFEEEKAEIRRGYEAEMDRLEKEMRDLQLEANLWFHEEFTRLKQEKDELESSLFWHLVKRHRRIINRWLPQNTRRRRLYCLCLRAPVVLFKEGLQAFFQKIAARMPVRSKVAQRAILRNRHGKGWRPLSFPRFDKKDVTIIIPVYNQCGHTFRCLESVLEHTTVPYEVSVVDNASDDDTAQMLGAMEGIRLIHNKENQGFVTACNQGSEDAEGKNYLFLNNDAEVTAGWLEAMLRPLDDKKVGIVGAKLVYPDGQLQEAGNIIWQDGMGWNYGRGGEPDLPQYSYLREVDYCSGACLLVRKDLWKELGGFDNRYAPAYYEDSDLCFAARQKGYKVIYQPEARVIHWEGISAGRDVDKGYKKYQQINRGKFIEKWQAVLGKDHFKGPDDLYLARERGFEKRVLILDHIVPTFDMDSGSLRMFNLIKIFMELGYKVIFWPKNRVYHERYTRELQRIGVEVFYGEIDFEKYLKSYGKYIDLIILSRPDVAFDYISAASTLTNARIIYDTVDLHFLREERKAKIEGKKIGSKIKTTELFLANKADEILVVSSIEKEILEREGFKGKVSVISNVHSLELCNNTFEDRAGLIFIGGFLHLPNEDGIVWFVKSILPSVIQRLPGIHLYIVGSHPTERVKSLASSDVIVTGYVEDVGPYFEKARVFVCPLRYGAGVKGKIGQSMAYGLPVVTTSIGAEGMGITDGHHALIADDEESFAMAVIKLYQDPGLWEKLSLNSRTLIEQNYSPDAVEQALRKLLEGDGGGRH